jgi:uncharacterized protein (UPF0261 family)
MHARSRYALHAFFVAGLLFAAAIQPAEAQSLAPRTPRVDVSAPKRPAAGPTLEAASVAARPTETKQLTLNAAAAPSRGHGQPFALMVVGGAAVLTGVIIGDDVGTVIAVGGALVGLYGLYEYLK